MVFKVETSYGNKLVYVLYGLSVGYGAKTAKLIVDQNKLFELILGYQTNTSDLQVIELNDIEQILNDKVLGDMFDLANDVVGLNYIVLHRMI